MNMRKPTMIGRRVSICCFFFLWLREVNAFSPLPVTRRHAASRSSFSFARAAIFSRNKKVDPISFNVTARAELDKIYRDEERLFRNRKGSIDYDKLIQAIHVEGDTQIIGSSDKHGIDGYYTHPVAKLLHERKRTASNLTAAARREDGCRLALSVEGGGMRGCISAGMICALNHLGLNDAFDVVYGSSAGSITSAYFITGQTQWFGPEVYYDMLPTAGTEFIDSKRLFRTLGLGLLDPRLIKDVLTRPDGKPVLNLSYLLKKTVMRAKPLDWEALDAKKAVQPLNVVMSGLKSEKEFVMNRANGGFSTLEELTDCMWASCLLPGVAGSVMNIDQRSEEERNGSPKMVLGNGKKEEYFEPVADSLIYQPLPFRAAIEDGATHVVMLRSRPDGADVTGKGGFFERLIFRRFFMRKNKLPGMFRRFTQHRHKKMYAEDVIRLNEEAYSIRAYNDTSSPHILTVATPPGSGEVARLESDRATIFDGFRRGFARAYDCLVEDPKERGRGHIVAREYFPDEILDYDPLTIKDTDRSAFYVHMEREGLSLDTLPSRQK